MLPECKTATMLWKAKSGVVGELLARLGMKGSATKPGEGVRDANSRCGLKSLIRSSRKEVNPVSTRSVFRRLHGYTSEWYGPTSFFRAASASCSGTCHSPDSTSSSERATRGLTVTMT